MAGSRRPSTDKHARHRWEIQYADTAFMNLDVAGANRGGDRPTDREEQHRTTTLAKFLMFQCRSALQRRSYEDWNDARAVLASEGLKLTKDSSPLARLMASSDGNH
jgi:hypothetical protein